MLFYSLKTSNEIFYTNPFGFPTNPQFSNYVRAVKSFNILLYFKNSLIVTIVATLGAILLSVPFSYAVSRMNWKFRKHISFYVSLGLFIPAQVIVIPLSILVKNLHIANTYWAVVLPYIAFNLALACMVLSSSFATLPKELEESAFIDGASIQRTFLSIMVPLIKPAIATTSIFTVINVWNEYLLASILLTDNSVKTLPIGLASFVGQYSTDWGAMGACMVIASVPMVVIYLVFSEQVESALTVSGAVKG
jgi:raffinose/stachyose/melibiose transport system permease protein